VQGAKPPEGVWGVPKNFYSLDAYGVESLRAIKLSLNKKGTTMDDQTYQIALSPDLHITLEEFAIAWNEDDIARTFAEAHLSQAKGTQFFDPMLVTVLLTVGTGVAANLLSDLIEGVIQRLIDKKNIQSGQATPSHKHTHIEHIKKPDGSEMLVIDIDES
jgi:hypothetical protein